jgi:hypothetical protein
MAAATPRPAGRGRAALAAVLIVLSCVLGPLTVTAIWLRNQLLNTDQYVETVTPLASDPAIIRATAADITASLFENVDVEKEARDALPNRAKFLAAPLAAGVRAVAEQAAQRALESDFFESVWVKANRVAHDQVEAVLTGGGRIVATADGRVVLDLTAIIEEVREFLSDRGVTLFNSIPINKLALKFELFDASQLESAQRGVKLLNTLAWVLPFVVVGLLVAGVWLSRRRHRTVIWWGIGTAIAMAVLALGINLGRGFYLEAVSSSTLPRDAAAATFDTLVRFLRQGLRFVLALGLVLAAAAWVTSAGKTAMRLRTTVTEVVGGLGDQAEARGWDFGPFGRWVHRYRGPLRVAGVLVVLLFLLFAYRNSAIRLLVLTLLLLVYLGAVEFVSRAARFDADAPTAENV